MIQNPKDLEALEDLIDRTTLAEVLEALEGICNGKAEHVRSAWQAPKLATMWERAAQRLESARISAAVTDVS